MQAGIFPSNNISHFHECQECSAESFEEWNVSAWRHPGSRQVFTPCAFAAEGSQERGFTLKPPKRISGKPACEALPQWIHQR
jgi:hypothetical protein